MELEKDLPNYEKSEKEPVQMRVILREEGAADTVDYPRPTFKPIGIKKEKAVNGILPSDLDFNDWQFVPAPVAVRTETVPAYKERLRLNLQEAFEALSHIKIGKKFFLSDLIATSFLYMEQREKIDTGIMFRSLINTNETVKAHFIEADRKSGQIQYQRIK